MSAAAWQVIQCQTSRRLERTGFALSEMSLQQQLGQVMKCRGQVMDVRTNRPHIQRDEQYLKQRDMSHSARQVKKEKTKQAPGIQWAVSVSLFAQLVSYPTHKLQLISYEHCSDQN